MSQPIQQFTLGDPANGYIVIDNGVPNVTITTAIGGLTYTQNLDAGFDCTVDASPFRGGAIGQDKNTYTNGTIPDAVNRSKSFTCTTAGVTNITKYLNPA